MIRVKNIYYMLAYAYKALNESGYDNIAAEDFENIQDLIACILARGIAQQIKQVKWWNGGCFKCEKCCNYGIFLV